MAVTRSIIDGSVPNTIISVTLAAARWRLRPGDFLRGVHIMLGAEDNVAGNTCQILAAMGPSPPDVTVAAVEALPQQLIADQVGGTNFLWFGAAYGFLGVNRIITEDNQYLMVYFQDAANASSAMLGLDIVPRELFEWLRGALVDAAVPRQLPGAKVP